MKKCFIAGSCDHINYKDYYDCAITHIENIGHEPVSPIPKEPSIIKNNWRWYFKEDLMKMLTCDMVYARHNYKESHIAKRIVELAIELGKDVIYETEKSK
jgi:hypothetical protein